MKASRNIPVMGVDLGGTNIVIAVVDGQGRIKLKSKIPTLLQEGPTVILKRMGAEILRVAAHAGLPPGSIKAVGVGSPGPLDARKGLVIKTPNLTGWRNVPVTRALGKYTGLKVFLENDGNAAAMGEAVYGAGRGYEQILVLTLGTGVGGGIILNGELYSGLDGTAGELGHMSLDPQGPLCGCGQRGCLEKYASATAIAQRARTLLKRGQGPLWKLCGGDVSLITAKMTHEALLLNDKVARQVWAETAQALGNALAGFINIFNPERIILAGGVMEGGKALLRDARKLALKRAFEKPASRVKIIPAMLGDDAGVIGAAEIARRAFLKEQE